MALTLVLSSWQTLFFVPTLCLLDPSDRACPCSSGQARRTAEELHRSGAYRAYDCEFGYLDANLGALVNVAARCAAELRKTPSNLPFGRVKRR